MAAPMSSACSPRSKEDVSSWDSRAAWTPVEGNLDATITLGETAAGAPPKVKAWYPESETHGREFIY